MGNRHNPRRQGFYDLVSEGMLLSIHCEGCGCWFKWRATGHPRVNLPPSYHSPACGVKHREWTKKQRAIGMACRRPDKRVYMTDRDAQLACERLRKETGELLRPYRCPCGWLHVGRLHYRILETPGEAHRAA